MIEPYTYRFRIYPDAGQQWLFRNTIGCCRVVYNRCMAERDRRWKEEGLSTSKQDMSSWLKGMKEELPFLKIAPHHTLVQTTVDLHGGYVGWYEGRAKHPAHRQKGKSEGFRFPDPKQFKIEVPEPGTKCREGRIFLPKAGWVKAIFYRDLTGNVRNITVTREADAWYVSIMVERECAEPEVRTGEVVGADAGVNQSWAFSTGEVYQLPKVSPEEMKKLGTLQGGVARKKNGSQNQRKARLAVSRFLARLKRRRKDAKQKLTTMVVRKHPFLAVENLRLRNMTASARGTVEEPGKNVAQKAGLNRSLLDQGIGDTHAMWEYKYKRAGGRILYVDPAYTSQRCSCCGHTEAANRVESRFGCLSCGHSENADLNAARNIARLGREMLDNEALPTGGPPGMACGSNPVGDRKQEEYGRETGSPVVYGGE